MTAKTGKTPAPDKGKDSEHRERRDTRQRHVQAIFSNRLPDYRNDARSRSQDQKKPACSEARRRRSPQSNGRGRSAAEIRTTCIGPDLGKPGWPRPSRNRRSGDGARRRARGYQIGGGQNDPFQEYLQVLHSSRLAIELAEKDKLLTKLFSDRWDAVHHRWKPPSATHEFVTEIERALHRPVIDHPDADTLADVLAGNFHVAEATSAASSLLTMGSGLHGSRR